MKLDANATAVTGGPSAVLHEFDRAFARPVRQTKRRLDTVTAEELAKRQFPQINFIIPGYLAQGLTILAGRPKIGKSWMALGWAVAVASGGVAFGSIEVEAGDALFLGLEDNQRRLQRRLDQLLPHAGKPRRLYLATECPRLGAGGSEAISEWCAGVENPRLVVVDVFGKVRPARHDRENLYDSDYRAIEPLKALADNLGIAVLVVHHTNKREDPFDPFDAVSGTTGLTGAADTVMVLSRSAQGVTLYGRGRDVDEIETALSFDKVTGAWVALGSAQEVRRSRERSKLLQALQSSAAPLGPRDLAAATGLKENNVRRLLGKMVMAGEVEKTAYASYRTTGGRAASVTDTAGGGNTLTQ
jgi:hypothetical protein